MAGGVDLIRDLEERAFAAWPALRTESCGGWLFRWSDGYTKRANSANALRPDESFGTIRAKAEAFYAGHGLPAIFRLSPLAGDEVDSDLAARGYRRIDETIVQTAVLSDGPAEPVTILNRPTPEWGAAFAAANGISAASRAIHDRMLDEIVPAMACASIEIGGEPAAFGLAVADRGWVGLFDIVTKPEWRRQGLARRMVAALLRWGREQGASRAYLQVVAANEPARVLYRSLGFTEAYRYHYRVTDRPTI